MPVVGWWLSEAGGGMAVMAHANDWTAASELGPLLRGAPSFHSSTRVRRPYGLHRHYRDAGESAGGRRRDRHRSADCGLRVRVFVDERKADVDASRTVAEKLHV